MKYNSKTEDYTDFFYHFFRNILLASAPILIISALILGFIPHSSAEVSSSSSDNVSFTLSTSCTISGEIISAHHAELHGGQVVEDVGNTKLNAYCNDNNGYSIYAIGSSNNTDGNTDLISSVSDNYNVHTGVYDSSTISPSTPSSWAMKLTAGVGTGPNPTVPTIENNYNTYKEVPNTYTLVAKRTSKTDMNLDTTLSGSYINTTYQIYASSIQPAGTYSGRVKYVMMHPSSNIQNFGFNEIFAVNGKTPAMVDGDKVYYAMQDMNANICSQVVLYNEASQTQLVDIRDNKLYWVAKLDDSNCWMTQNLELDIKPDTILSSASTDLNVIYDSLNGQYAEYDNGYTKNDDTIYWRPATSFITTGFTGTTVTDWQNSNITPYSTNKTDSTEIGHLSLGNYYNWTAAIASNDASSLTQNNTNANNSICPKGWRLPKNTTSEYQGLADAYNITPANALNLHNSPLYFTIAGYIDGNSLKVFNQLGYYWTNMSRSSNNAYNLYFGGGNFSPANDRDRFRGFPIRCLAE